MPTDPGSAQFSGDRPAAGAVRTQIDRILASPSFINAVRLSRFLRFVTEKTLAGESAAVKESVIGVEVFGRRADTYDPSADSVVRVQARRLRTKLDEYYQVAGADDRLVVELPRGRYVPSFRLRRVDAHSVSTPRGHTGTDDHHGNSVAVLPFVNVSSDPENEYFSDGLTEELIHALTGIPSLQVAARSSSFQFKGKNQDIREIGTVLGVGRIVEGSVRKSKDRLRITVQLINVADGCHLWSERYDRPIADVFALQDEIARSIRQMFSGGRADSSERRGTRTANHDAFDHYLKGRFHWAKRDERGFRAALDHFGEAIRADPRYGQAYSGLADCQVMLAMSGAEAPRTAMPRARQAALRALELDDSLVEAHTSLAGVLANFDWERRAAEAEYRRALDLDDGYATLHHWYSVFLLAPERRLPEALDVIKRAAELDPVSLPINLDRALVHVFAGQYDAAIEQCRKVLDLDAGYHRTHWFLGLIHERLGQNAKATNALETALALDRAKDSGHAFRSRIQGALGRCYGRSGHPGRAHAVLLEMEATARTAYVDQFELAQIHLGLGDLQGAMARLERAAEERSSYLMFANVWPGFEVLRPIPEFRSLLSRLSLDAAGEPPHSHSG